MRRSCWLLLVFVPLMLSASSRAAEPAPAEDGPIYQGKTLAEWIDDLKDPKKDNHSTAAQALAVIGPKKESVSALASVLKDADNSAILHAAQTLGKFGPKAKEALPAVRIAYKRLKDGPPKLESGERWSDDYLKTFAHVRQAVTEALILIDDHPGPEMTPILLQALETNNADKRRDIVIRLGKLGPDAAKTTVPALIAVLASTDKDVSEAGRLRGSYASDASSINAPTPEQIKQIRLEAVKSLGRIGPAAKPALHALTLAMKTAAPEKKATRWQQIGVSAKPAAAADATVRNISFSIVTSDTGDAAMLRACAEALGRIRPEAGGTLGALRLALRDLDDGVRWAALCALLESGQDTREVVPILEKFLHDKDAALRRVAVEVLGKSGGDTKQILPALTAALKDGDTFVRESAAKALGDLGPKAKHAIPALIAALKDTESKVRAAGVEALGKIGVPDKDVIQALVTVLNDKEISVFREASKVLGKFGHRSRAAVPGLLVILDDSNADKRAITCLVLGSIAVPTKEVVSTLEKISQTDAAEHVRLAAHGGLAKMDSSRLKETLPRLTAALRSKDVNVLDVAEISLTLLGRDACEVVDNLRALRDQTSDAN